jgi:hypothetical protein
MGEAKQALKLVVELLSLAGEEVMHEWVPMGVPATTKLSLA